MSHPYTKLQERNAAGGGLSDTSLSVWHCLLEAQKDMRIDGNLLELGIWHGIGLSAMGLHAKAKDRLYGIDVALQKNKIKENFEAITKKSFSNIVLLESESSTLRKTGALARECNTFRWIHIDGEHSFDGVCNDLDMAMSLMRDDGIVVIDDFFNIASANVTQALFYMLERYPHYIRMFLAGGNKAYVSSPKFHGVYRSICRDKLAQHAETLFGLNLAIARNGHDREIDYLTFFDSDPAVKAMRIGEYLPSVPADF